MTGPSSPASADQLVGRVQQRYGIAKDEAEKQVAEFERNYENV